MVPVAHRFDRALQRRNRLQHRRKKFERHTFFTSDHLYYSGMNLRALAPLVVAGAFALTACGGGDNGSSGTTLPADVTVAAVDGLVWDATDYAATAGEITISVVNESSLPHNLHIVDADGVQLPEQWDIPSRNDTASDTVTLSAGTYTLICTIPGHANMKATLTVS
jgi:plastocyanin